MELKKESQRFRTGCSDQLPLVVTKGIIQGEEDALFISRFAKFLHCLFGQFSQQLSSFIQAFSPKTLSPVTSQECALALVSLRVHSVLPPQQDGF